MLARKPINMPLQNDSVINASVSNAKASTRVSVLDTYKSLTANRKAVVRLFLLIAATIIMALTYQSSYDQQALICANAENQVILLKHEKSMLELEVTELKAPNRIQTIAMKELGMVAPSEFIYSSHNAKMKDVAATQITNVRD